MKIINCWKLFLFTFFFTSINSEPGVEDRSLDEELGPYFDVIPPSGKISEYVSSVPRLPEGNLQFQLYTLNREGKLQKQWMSIQEIQNIVLAHSINRHLKIKDLQTKVEEYNEIIKKQEEQEVVKNSLSNDLQRVGFVHPSSGNASVDDVLANVQKVMSREVAETKFNQENAEDSTKDALSQSLITEEPLTTTPRDIFDEDIESLSLLDSLNLEASIDDNLATSTASNFYVHNDLLEDFGISTTESSVPSTKEYDNKFGTPEFNFELESSTPAFDKYQVSPDEFSEIDLEGMFGRNPVNRVLSKQDSLTSAELRWPKPSERDVPASREKVNDYTKLITIHNQDKHRNPEPDSYSYTKIKPFHEIKKPAFHELKNTHSHEVKNTPYHEVKDTSFHGVKNTPYHEVKNTPYHEVKNTPFHEVKNTPYHEVKDTTFHKLKNTPYHEIKDTPYHEVKNTPYHEVNKPPSQDVKKKHNHGNLPIIGYPFQNQKQQLDPIQNFGNIDILANINGLLMKSNVLSPSEIGNRPQNIHRLEHETDTTPYDAYALENRPLYLEDIDETAFDYDQLVGSSANHNFSNQNPFDFPSPDVTDSYAPPSHLPVRGSQPSEEVNPEQFLPQNNAEIGNQKSPLRKTPTNNVGLTHTTAHLDHEVREYINEMNNVIFKVYAEAIQIHRRQNLVMSSLNLVSTLSMMLLGARGSTADALSTFLKTEMFRNFNPHLVLKNVTQSVLDLNYYGHESAAVNSFFVEKSASKAYSLDFFGRTIDYFYEALAKQVDKNQIGTEARDLANEMIRRRTRGAVRNFLKPNSSLHINGPLAAVASAYLQIDWQLNLREGELTDMNFIRFPSAERRLIRTVGVSKKLRMNAGYSEQHDTTIAEVPVNSNNEDISLLLVMPGQQKHFVANGLVWFEKSLTSKKWNEVLTATHTHDLELKMPIYSHRNYLNLTGILSGMNLGQLFSDTADFSGVNGVKDLRLGDVIQLCEFHSCKLDLQELARSAMESSNITAIDTPEDVDEQKSDQIFAKRMGTPANHVEGTLAFDRAFMYVVRHNPTGLILYIGRYLDPETF